MNTDLNDLIAYVAVVEQGSFTGAARALNLPKSTVSRKVARLEDQLSARLIQRSTRKLVITESGKRLYEHGRRIAQELEEAEQTVMQMGDMPMGLLKVTVPVELGANLMPVIASYLEAYPSVQVELDFTNRYVDLVAEGYHVAIRAGQRLADNALMARKLSESRAILIASPEYVDAHGTPENPEDLAHHQCVLFPKFQKQPRWTLHCESGPVEVNIQGKVAANNLEATKQAALNGLGIARVPQQFCTKELSQGTLVEVLPQTAEASGSLWVVYPENRYPTPKVRTFVDYLITNSQEVTT